MQEVAKNIFVATHFRGPSVSAILSKEGYVLIDAPPFPEDSKRWKSFLDDKANGKPSRIRAMILTDHNPERLLGAHHMQPDILVAHRLTYEYIKNLPSSYVNTIANMLTRSTLEQSEIAQAKIELPVATFEDELQMNFGKFELRMVHRPGPTKGSIYVQYLKARLLFAGDIIVVGAAPYLNSLNSEAWLATLEEIDQKKFPADIIVSGHGNITVKTAIDPIRQYLETARERIRNIYEHGQSLSDMGKVIHELLNFFPPPLESELAEVQHRVRNGLQAIYNEFRQNDMANQPTESKEEADE